MRYVRTTCGSGWLMLDCRRSIERRSFCNGQPPATAGGSDLFTQYKKETGKTFKFIFDNFANISQKKKTAASYTHS